MGELRFFSKYSPMVRQNWHNQQIVRSTETLSLVNNTLAVYAACRRNQQVIVSSYPTNTDYEEMVLVLEPGQTRTIVVIPADGLIAGGVPLTAYVFCSTATEDHNISLELSCGSSQGATANIEDTTEVWHSVTCYPERAPFAGAKDDRRIILQVRNDDADDSETITIDSISIFEEPDPNCTAWIDWTGATNMIGVDDQAYTPAMLGILKSNLDYVAKQRLPKANIFNRCLQGNARTTEAAYEAANDGLGRYIVRTKADVDELKVVLNVDVEGTDDPAPNDPKATFRVGAYDIDGNSIDSFEVEVTGSLQYFGKWVSDTLDISGRTAGDDTIEIRVDSKETNGEVLEQYLWNIFVGESAVAADISYELPNRSYVQPDDDIRAIDILNVKNTITHLYNRATQTLLNDLRVYRPAKQMRESSSYLSTVSYKGMTRTQCLRWSNNHVARGVLYPSDGAKYLIFDVVLGRPDPMDVCRVLEYENETANFEDISDYAYFSAIVLQDNAQTYEKGWARLIDIDTTNNLLFMDEVAGFWSGSDPATPDLIVRGDEPADTATIVGAPYAPDSSDVDLMLWFDISHGTPFSTSYRGTPADMFHVYAWRELRVGNDRGLIRRVIKIPIPEETWDDAALADAHYEADGTPARTTDTHTMPGPIVFQVEAYGRVYQYNRPVVRIARVYEETPNVL